MNTMAWIAIGVAAANMVFTVVWSLMRRPGQRIDRLEAAVFGETGVNMRLTRYVTTESFEKRMTSIDEHLRGVSEEGQRREDRILSAITSQGEALSQSLGELRHDVRQQASRVDALLQKGR